MYLACPSGLLDVLYSAFADNEYKSIYWTKKDDMMVLKYDWEDATYLYTEKKAEFRKEVRLSIQTTAKTFNFQILGMEKSVNPKTGLTEMLTFDMIETTQNVKGTFFIATYELEEKVYKMNHMPRSAILDAN